MSDVVTAPEPDAEAGRRIRRVITTKDLATQDWIFKNIVPKGTGYTEKLGRLVGIAMRSETKTQDVRGKMVESTALHGTFELEIFSTGEMRAGSIVYLPDAFACQISNALKLEGVRMAQIDIDIGVECTGKSIPYEWTIHSYIDGDEVKALKAIRNRRSPRAVPELIEGEVVQQIAPPAEVLTVASDPAPVHVDHQKKGKAAA